MSCFSQEIVLHALKENGQVQPSDIEAYIKDDIERESGKISEMTRRIRQAYKEVVRQIIILYGATLIRKQTTAPVIEDDMLFADNGEMLLEFVDRQIARYQQLILA